MRRLGFAALTANPDLQQYRKIAAGERVKLWANAAVAGQASLVAQLGGTNICSAPIPQEAGAGFGPRLDEDIPMFDVIAVRDAELALNFTFGTTNCDVVLMIDP